MRWYEKFKQLSQALKMGSECNEERRRKEAEALIKKGDDKAARHIATGKLNVSGGSNET